MRLNRNGKSMKTAMTAWVVTLVVLCSWTLTACGAAEQDTSGDEIRVVTTFFPLYDFSRKIGGEHADVTNLVPAGVEAHDWSPKPQDMANMSDADLFVYNGWGFEGWVNDVLDTLGDSKGPVIVEAVQGIEPVVIHEDDSGEDGEAGNNESGGHHSHDHGMYDPHVWMSPLQAMTMAENILNGFIEADPAHQTDYEANFAKLRQELERLHNDYESVISNANRKDLVVSHHAYAYLARDYGLKQVAVMGLSPESKPTARDMARILEYIKDHDVQYILFEELASPELAETLAKDAGVELLPFHPVEGLTPEQEANGEDYVSIMRSNLDVLKTALQS